MILSSFIRGDHKRAARYFGAQGKNDFVRVVEISDMDANDMKEAFHNMWIVALHSNVKKLLHHVIVSPCKDERLSDEQIFTAVDCCEERFGYRPHDHQRVIVEHIKAGAQHFHVLWNRVSLRTARIARNSFDKLKAMKVAEELEARFGLKRAVSKRLSRLLSKPPAAPSANAPTHKVEAMRPASHYARRIKLNDEL